MTLVLKQSTSIDIRMGPFVDATDGVTPETGVTLGAADQAEVLKANGAATVAMAGTFAAVTGADGWYDYTVQTGDVDTVGEVTFVVQDSSVCLPVFVRAMVLEEAIYDALYGSGASGFDASGRVDVGSVGGTAQTANDNGADLNTLLTRIVGTLAAGTHTAQTGDAYARLGAPAGASVSADIATIDGNVDTINGRVLGTIAAGTHVAQTGDSFARIGATGSGLTTLATQASISALNNVSAADVNAQCDAAIADAALATAAALATVDTVVDAILADTAEIGVAGAGLTALANASDLATVDANVDTLLSRVVGTIAAGTHTAQTGDSYARLGAPAGASVSADIAAVPTATENADALLNRDMSAVSDTNARSPLNALRATRNRTAISGGTVTVYKENDSTVAWTAAATTDAAADLITEVDPA